MARHIALGILAGFLGFCFSTKWIYAQSEGLSQGAVTEAFLQNVRNLEVLAKWGPQVQGLRMSIIEDDEDDAELTSNPNWEGLQNLFNTGAARGHQIHVLTEIRNEGNQDVTILTGGSCGKVTGLTSNVKFNLSDSQGRTVQLQFLGEGPPYQGVCAGQLVTFFATIPAGKFFAAVLDLGKYMNLSDDQHWAMAHLPVGTYTIQAQLDLRLRPEASSASPVPVTSGGRILTSNTVQLQLDSEFSTLLPLSSR